VIDKRLLDAAEVERARSVAAKLLGATQPWHEDTLTITYAPHPPSAAAPAFVYLDQGWYELERAPSDAPAEDPSQWRWMAEEAQLRLMAPGPGEYRLTLETWAFREPTRLAILLDEVPLATLDIAPEHTAYEIPVVTAQPGMHVLRLRSLHRARTAEGTDRRPLSVAVSKIRLEPGFGSDQHTSSRGDPRP
jgi:hypothetical protein